MKTFYDGKKYLMISEDEIKKMVEFHQKNEQRSNDLLKEELDKSEDTQKQEVINMYAHQEIKARGFKEAWEELRMNINISDLVVDKPEHGWKGECDDRGIQSVG